ncbi:MAG: WG repeat-containing protein [Sulfurovum sp.]|nr:MAG: WG repeat-containing protein [Sulfurovum sp.]
MKSFIYMFTFSLLLLSGCDKISNTPPQNYIYPNKFYLPDVYLKKLNFKNKNILEIRIKDKWYYVKPNGEAIQAFSDKNHADRFVEGLARTVLDGKMGFFNRNLEVVIKPMYDFAYPFHDGVAEVCIGCNAKEIDKKIVDGGNWKKIDRNGLIID